MTLARIFRLFPTIVSAICLCALSAHGQTAVQFGIDRGTSPNQIGVYDSDNVFQPFMTMPAAGGGPFTTLPSTTAKSGFNIAPGVAPTSPNNGDMWTTNGGLYVQINGGTVGPLSETGSGSFAATFPLVVSFSEGVATYSLNYDSAFALSNNKLALAPIVAGALLGNSSGSTAEPAAVQTGTGVLAALSNPLNGSGGVLSTSLASGDLFIGNGSGIAAGVPMSGDATISNSGALTLSASGVTAGTYGDGTHSTQVTFDAKGRAISATSVAITHASGDLAIANNLADLGSFATARGNLSVVATVGSNAQLAAWSLTNLSAGAQIQRTGFYATGDAPTLVFTLETGNCAANSLVNNGGGCVDSATSGFSWVAAKTSVVDLREFGEVGDFGGSNTDNAAADAAGVAYACALAQFSEPRVTVTDGGVPEGIASAIPFVNCHGVKLDLSLHALSGSWTNGIPTTSTITLYGPNQSNPIISIAGVWTPPSPWPSEAITAISSDGGLTELTLAGSLGLTTGQRVLVQGSTGLANLNNTWVATVVDSTHITVPLTYAAGGSGGTVWGPLPVGMIDVQSTSTNIHLGTSTIDCNQQAGCIGVTNYGNLEAFGPLIDEGADIYGYTSSAGLFGFGAGASVKAIGGFARQLGATQADRNGYGFYFAGGSTDNYVQNVETPFNYAGALCDYGSTDCNVRISHTWSGNPPNSPAVGPFYQVCNTIYKASGSFSSNTVDAGPVCIVTTTAGASPQVQINGTFGEALNNSLFDAPIVYFANCSTPGCASLTTNGNRLGIDPFQNAEYPITNSIGSWQVSPAIALESMPGTGLPEGMINSAVWNAQARDIAARLNNHTSSFAKPTSNITAQPAVTFTGTLVSGSTTITGVTLFPQIGGTVSDSGGCIAGSPVLGWASFFNGSGTPAFPTPGGSMQLAGGATASASCSNDTITVGSVSWTGATVTSGSGFISGIDFNAPSLRPGVEISGTGIPSGSWVQGWDVVGQRLEFNNATGTGATVSASESLTLTPSNYTLQPDDDGVAFVVPGGAPTFDLSPFVNAGWHAEVDILTGAATLAPLGSATLNNGTSSITLTQNQNLITAAGTFGAASNYLTSLLGLPQAGGQLTGAAFPTLSGAGLAVGNGTPPTLSTNGQATVSAIAGNGLVLSGKGSLNDVEIANASKQAAITIPTGTTNVKLPALSTNGIVTVSGTTIGSEAAATTAQGGLGADNSSASGIPIFASGVVSMASLNVSGGIPQINGTPTVGNCLKWSASGVEDAGVAACPAGGFTVATLPAGMIGEKAYVTDATSCTFLGALTGGGSAFCPVVYNGSAWVGG